MSTETQKVDVRKPYQGAQVHLMGSSRYKPACNQRNPRAVATLESFRETRLEDRCEKCEAIHARVGGAA